MSLKVIIYAKQNGAQMATFAATGTRADIDDLREDNGGPGNEVASWKELSNDVNRIKLEHALNFIQKTGRLG